MRLWTIHPAYLDQKGLVALWREGLLAQKVLAGNTKGYRRHPQIIRFRECIDPMSAIGKYLLAVAKEAEKRGYVFNKKKIIAEKPICKKIPVKRGQVRFEYEHLLYKLKRRAKHLYLARKKERTIRVNPAFRIISGGIEGWEKAKK